MALHLIDDVLSHFESDNSLKLRHKEFHHWGKLLRELVECYGQEFADIADDTPVLYHGVSKALLFDSTYVNLSNYGLRGTVSTEHNI